jgi:hypothetical protein
MNKNLFLGMFATAFLSSTAWLYWSPLTLGSFMLITGSSVLVNVLLFYCISWVRSERFPFPVKPMTALFLASAFFPVSVFVLSFDFPADQIGTALMVRYAGASFVVAVAMAMITTENIATKAQLLLPQSDSM